MNRRTFLRSLFSAGVALAAAPSLLSLVPKAAPVPSVFAFSCTELVMTEELLERYIRPAAAAMADDIDDRIASHLLTALTPLECAA